MGCNTIQVLYETTLKEIFFSQHYPFTHSTYIEKSASLCYRNAYVCRREIGKDVRCSNVKLAKEKLPDYQQGIIQQIRGHSYYATLSNS